MDSRRISSLGVVLTSTHNLILARIKLFFGLKIAVCYIDVFTKYGGCGDGKILFDLLLDVQGKQLGSYQDGQFLNHTVPEQAFLEAVYQYLVPILSPETENFLRSGGCPYAHR